jgi:calcium-dependent protein kinase
MGCTSSVHAVSSPVTALEEPEDFHSKYVIGAKIGKGAYAQVHLASNKLVPNKKKNAGLAVKVRNLRSKQSIDARDKKVCVSACREVCLWSHVGSHPNCVYMHESFVDDNLCYMVMEKCESSLISYVNGMSGISERSLSTVFSQMLRGLSHIHSVSIVHRDVKSDNFLVGGKDGKTVKLTDFGLSAYVPEAGKVAGICGTAPYMSPEMLSKRECDLKTDMWSFGSLVHLMLIGRFPYMSPDGSARGMKVAIIEGHSVKCARPWLSSEASSFLQCLLHRKPDLRASATFALDMAFLSETSKRNEAQYASLRSMLESAAYTGAFEPANLTELSSTDMLLSEMQNGNGKRSNSKVLVQHQIDELLGATAEKVDQLVESFWLPGHNSDVEKMSSTTSTSCGTSDSNSSKGTHNSW